MLELDTDKPPLPVTVMLTEAGAGSVHPEWVNSTRISDEPPLSMLPDATVASADSVPAAITGIAGITDAAIQIIMPNAASRAAARFVNTFFITHTPFGAGCPFCFSGARSIFFSRLAGGSGGACTIID